MDEQVYKFEHNPHGLALIIVNKTFKTSLPKGGLKYRHGAEKDLTKMQKLFEALNFKVEGHEELSAEQMLSVLTEASKMSHAEFDCFVCVISTHGEEVKYTNKDGETTTQHVIYGTDGNFNYTSNLTKLFDDCPGLAGKPKLFFIQACRSFEGQDKEDLGHEFRVLHESKSVTDQNKLPEDFAAMQLHTRQESTEVGKDEDKDVSEDACQESQVPKEVFQEAEEDFLKRNGTSHACQLPSSIVCFRDELIMWAVVSGFKAQRCIKEGSWLLTYLFEELNKMQPNEPLLHALTRVSYKMAEDKLHGFINVVSCINHRLRREIFFSRNQKS